jgi:hypothetical protein
MVSKALGIAKKLHYVNDKWSGHWKIVFVFAFPK